MTLSALFSGCWLTHLDRVRERDSQGRLVLVCERCGDRVLANQSDVIAGPQHQPRDVLGAVTTKAVKVAKVTPLKRRA